MLPSWVGFVLLSACAANLSLAIFILYKGRKSKIHLTFSVFLLTLIGLTVTIYLVFSVQEINQVKAIGKWTFAFGSLSLSAFLAFTEVFPRPLAPKAWKKRLVGYYLVGFLFFLFCLTDLVQKDVVLAGDQFRPVVGWGIFAFGAYMVFCIVLGYSNLIRKYYRLPKGYEKNQLKYTFVGLFILVSPVIFVNLVFHFFGLSQYSALTPSFTVIMVIFISYAIIRHRLMDLGVVFRNSVIYLLVVIFLVGIGCLFQILLQENLNFPPLLSILLLSVVVAISLQPIWKRIEYLTDKYLFKGRYNYQEVITNFSDRMTKILDLGELVQCVVDNIVSIMQAESGSIMIPDKDWTRYAVEYSSYDKFDKIDFDEKMELANESILIKELKNTRKILVKDEIKRTRSEKEFDIFDKELEKIHGSVLVPLVVKEVLLGIVVLGEKRSGDIYSYQDVNLLYVLGNHIATALENSRLFNEILVMKNHNELILEHLSSGVITMDTSYRITSFNRRAREILGLRDQDVVGKEVSVLGERLSRILINRLRTPIRYLEEEAYVSVEGKGEIPLGVVSTVMKGQEDILGVLLVFNDLTNEKLLQEKIRRADRLASVGTLAAGMAHEIKNPLVSIKTFSQLLPEKYDDREFRETFSSITIREVERINHIVEQLLNFARPLRPKLQEADVHTIIEETLELVAEEISEKKIDIVRHFTSEPSVILVDREQIKQVILNLLKNSLQAVKGDKGRVEILTSFISEPMSGDYRLASELAGDEKEPIDAALLSDLLTKKFRIQIRDNGVGITKENLSNLFDPFFTTKSDGFGLGLAIAHGIVQEHNGTVEIESEVEVGTTVTVKLPAIKAG